MISVKVSWLRDTSFYSSPAKVLVVAEDVVEIECFHALLTYLLNKDIDECGKLALIF